MTNGVNGDAVAVRSFGTGEILNFNHAGNYGEYPALSNAETNKIIVI